MATQPAEVRLARHAGDLDDDGHDKASPWRELVNVATTANITIATALNDGDTLDGITLRDRMRVLVKNQSTPSQNGIYVVGTTPARSTDFVSGSIYTSFLVIVLQGTAGAGTAWRLDPGTSGQVLVGTDDIDWVSFGAGVTDHGALTGLSDDDHTQYVLRSILTTKGDLFARTTTGVDRVAVGTNDYVLTADSTASTGVAWKVPAGSGTLDDLTDVDTSGVGDGDVLTYDSGTTTWVALAPTGGGGAVSWTLDVDENGTSFANYTAASGTWSSNGTEIIQTNTSASPRRAKYNTKVPIGWGTVYEADILFPTSGQGGGGNIQGGLLLGFDGSNDGGLVVLLDKAVGGVEFAKESASSLATISTTVSLDTTYTLRLVLASEIMSVYIDGTLFASQHVGELIYRQDASYVGLFSYGASVKWSNIKLWTMRGGAP